MATASVSFEQLAATSKQLARRLLTIGENRLELMTVEVQEDLPPHRSEAWQGKLGWGQSS